MRTTNILTASFLVIASMSVYGQETQDREKQRSIELNPTKYTEQGGVLTKKDTRTSKKSVGEEAGFVIHKSSNQDSVRGREYATLEELNTFKDQTSSEYQVLKENWIMKHQLEYNAQNPTVPKEVSRSTEERLNKHNQ
jgi:hypothetical protein